MIFLWHDNILTYECDNANAELVGNLCMNYNEIESDTAAIMSAHSPLILLWHDNILTCEHDSIEDKNLRRMNIMRLNQAQQPK